MASQSRSVQLTTTSCICLSPVFKVRLPASGVSAGDVRQKARCHQVKAFDDVLADDSVMIEEGNDGTHRFIGTGRGRAERRQTAQIHGLCRVIGLHSQHEAEIVHDFRRLANDEGCIGSVILHLAGKSEIVRTRRIGKMPYFRFKRGKGLLMRGVGHHAGAVRTEKAGQAAEGRRIQLDDLIADVAGQMTESQTEHFKAQRP